MAPAAANAKPLPHIDPNKPLDRESEVSMGKGICKNANGRYYECPR